MKTLIPILLLLFCSCEKMSTPEAVNSVSIKADPITQDSARVLIISDQGIIDTTTALPFTYSYKSSIEHYATAWVFCQNDSKADSLPGDCNDVALSITLNGHLIAESSSCSVVHNEPANNWQGEGYAVYLSELIK